MNPEITGELWKHFITPFDFALLPFYIAIVYFFALRNCNRKYPPRHPWRRYFLTGFFLKIAGAIFVGLVYEYYYHGGDTSAFFYHANVINQSLGDSVIKWINLLFRIPDVNDMDYYQYINQMMWYRNGSAYMVSSITAFLNVFTFNTYLPTSVLFAALSFSGNWAMFRTFAEQYPKLTKYVAIAVLFIPSTFVWGSGIFKDTICLSALGWLTFATFRILIRKQMKFRYFLTAAFCFYILAVVKIYIVLVYIPALALWILSTYSQMIRNGFVRSVLRVFVYATIIVGFILVSQAFAKELGRYSLENIAQTSSTTRGYIYWASTQSTGGEEGSAYSLGDFDPTPAGMLRKFPLAVNVTLFRPYPWESRKPMVLLNSIEAFLFLFFTLKVIIAVGIGNFIKAVRKNANVQFFLVFTLIFAFAVGISSYNFGALSRYRIPCLPFYALALVTIYYQYKPLNKKFLSLSFK
jgi:hypothetical protein